MYKFFLSAAIFAIFGIQALAQKVDNSKLFELDLNPDDNFVKIIPVNEPDFLLPDSAVTRLHEVTDFNADNKEDAFVYLGACGTGGCMYGIFLNQNDNYYKLVFIDYLKSPSFEKESNGYLSITSYEEVEPYNPSKVFVTKFVFDENMFQYIIDTTYIDQ